MFRFTKSAILSAALGSLLACSPVSPKAAGCSEPFPVQICPCLAARDTLGPETRFTQLTGARESGTSCVVSAMFKDADDLRLFEAERVSRGEEPRSIEYQGKRYSIIVNFGSTVSH